ncbi:MAG TPA: carboxypeptidase regulatory-like domain-containing protein [Gemmatimonadaceae bacterium]|nr:carboxypeptidase regulatory-like domain-containing protein [Gemmatimonadaceae bacterium]
MRIPRWTLGGFVAAALAFALALPATAAAQGVTTGAIAGTVTNDQGQPVEAAQVQVINRTTGFSSRVTTKADGRYIVPGLEVGSSYAVTVRRLGFQPVTRENVTVVLSQVTRIDLQLVTQAAQLQAVNVLGTQDPVMSTSHTGVTTTISDSSLRRLPTLNRNFTDFVALTPQVSTVGPGLSGGGVNNRFNNIQIDGSTEADLFGLGSTGQPGGQANGKSISLEAVKEYQVLLSPYDVRQANFSGLLVNAVTKSGTNDWHGSLVGVGRNQGLTRSQPYINKYNQTQGAFSLGGPLVRDKALFFVAGDWQARSTPASGPYIGSSLSGPNQAIVDEVNGALSKYGMPTGSGALINNGNPLANLFARLDFNLPGNSQLVIRDNYGRAVQDIFSRSASSYSLDNNGYHFKSKKNAAVAQLRTLFSNSSFNELLLNYETIRDRRAPGARAPQVTVYDGGFGIIDGAERYSQGNELDQDLVELTDNYTMPFGAHRVTIGATGQWYKVRNLFTQASYGVWTFGTLDSLNAGNPRQYVVGVPLSGDGAVRFRAGNFGGYIQDEWTATQRFSLTYGVRFDDPIFFTKPPFNQSVSDGFGRNTQDVPSGNIQWSPRVGFNWDVTGDSKNQLRGGAGLFTGRPAYVWLSNAFQNSGSVGVGVLTCNGTAAPKFTSASVATPPQACANGVTAKAGGEIDLLSKDLKFPQNARFTLGYDRQLMNHWVGTLEAMYTKGINNPFYQNIALAGQQGTDPHGRVLYGLTPFNPVLKVAGRNVVLDVSNQSNDYSYNLTAGIQRQFYNHFAGSVFYTYSKVMAVQDLTSSTAASQYTYGRDWAGDESDPTATRSDFEQKHHIVAQGTYSFPSRTDLSFTYLGGSGQPIDYVYSGDLNGDGYSNDPIYIPRDAHNTSEIQFSTLSAGGVTYTPQQQADALENFIKSNPCLNSQRGQIMTRNACTTPWTNLVNVAVRQSFGAGRFQNISLEMQVFNFMNLLNKNWGHQEYVGFSGSQTLMTEKSIAGGNLTNGVPVVQFNPTFATWNANNLSSNYQLQFQVKYAW